MSTLKWAVVVTSPDGEHHITGFPTKKEAVAFIEGSDKERLGCYQNLYRLVPAD